MFIRLESARSELRCSQIQGVTITFTSCDPSCNHIWYASKKLSISYRLIVGNAVRPFKIPRRTAL